MDILKIHLISDKVLVERRVECIWQTWWESCWRKEQFLDILNFILVSISKFQSIINLISIIFVLIIIINLTLTH